MTTMVAQNLLNDVLSLPFADRMKIFERLQENLQNDPAYEPSNPAHHAVLKERLAAFDANPSAGSSWDEVESRILQRLKDRK
jgi:putative addiction module component (TIGR02574 family)